jgi:hypothetical protein
MSANMQYQLRLSDNEKFYYLLSIDEDGNEKVVIESPDINEIRKLPEAKGLVVVSEKHTRGTVVPE